MKQNRRRSCLPITIILIALLVLAGILVNTYVPNLAAQTYGPPNQALSGWQRFSYSIRLLWNTGALVTPEDPYAPEQTLVINQGESVVSISERLQACGLIRDASTFRIYLIWSGHDTSVQAGTYRLNAGQTGMEIANALQNPSPTDAVLVVLPGWRMEEIAATLATSGLEITAADFLTAATYPSLVSELLPAGTTAEGYLYPDQYTLPRSTTATELVSILLSNFTLQMTSELREGYSRNGLDVYQAVTMASIIEREAVVDEEMPIIASVFYNRLAASMKLESDPTVQYALGYSTVQETWWTNQLSQDDLQYDSPFNTYIYYGLPPAPIANPGIAALQAVAYPAKTQYYYFMARCDDSGLHKFSETFEEHRRNICP